MSQLLAINYAIADLQAEHAAHETYYQERLNALLAEQRAILSGEITLPPKKLAPQRKRRSKAEMERDVMAAIRYLLDEEYNGATQTAAEKSFGLPAGILSKGKWAEMIEKNRKMR